MAEAASLNLTLVSGRPAREGFGEAFPTITEMVRAITSSPIIYPVLSAVVHGETWALAQVGYAPSDAATWGFMLKKEPPAAFLAFALMAAMQAFAQSVWADVSYRGWEPSATVELLESAYESASLKEEVRFWRTPR